MPASFILIPGRSSRQGVAMNEGKYTDAYRQEISTLRMNPDDMHEMSVAAGDQIRVWNKIGEFVAPCIDARNELPRGMLFIVYGDLSCRVMSGETHGSGMPDSKGMDVFAEPAMPLTRSSAADPETVVSAEESGQDADRGSSRRVVDVQPEIDVARQAEPVASPTTPKFAQRHSHVAIFVVLATLALLLITSVS
jgi:formylmethanofuran dehydrogenase subunit D